MTANAKQDAEIVALKGIVQELGARLDKLEAATVDADGRFGLRPTNPSSVAC
jgi:UDP-N-acetylglucosamine enolpyruvyl transferase